MIGCAGGCFWLKPVAMTLFVLCNAVTVVCAFLKLLCVWLATLSMCGIMLMLRVCIVVLGRQSLRSSNVLGDANVTY